MPYVAAAGIFALGTGSPPRVYLVDVAAKAAQSRRAPLMAGLREPRTSPIAGSTWSPASGRSCRRSLAPDEAAPARGFDAVHRPPGGCATGDPRPDR